MHHRLGIKETTFLVSLLMLLATFFGGCAREVPGDLSSRSQYEPLVDQVYWCDEELGADYKAFFLGEGETPPSDCTELSDMLKVAEVVLPLDTEDRITTYAWELAKTASRVETATESEWYVFSAYHYPDGILLVNYVPRNCVTSEGDTNGARGSSLTHLCYLSGGWYDFEQTLNALNLMDADGDPVSGSLYRQSSAAYTSDGNYVENVTNVNGGKVC